MALLSFFGLLIGLGAVAYVLWVGGILRVFLDLNAFILVFGGTLGTTMVTFPWKYFKQIPKAWWRVFFPKAHKNPQEVIEELMGIQQTAWTGSVDDIDAGSIRDEFMRSGVRLLIEGQELEDVSEELRTEAVQSRQRSQRIIDMFRAMGDYAPVFGLLGTLVGIVQVLKFLGNAEQMGTYMALAITTTFYGIFGTNFIFLPTAGKLEGYADDGLLINEVIIVGIVSIHKRETPTVMRRRLERFVARRTKTEAK